MVQIAEARADISGDRFVGTGTQRYVPVPVSTGVINRFVLVAPVSVTAALYSSSKAFNPDGTLSADAELYRVTPDFSGSTISQLGLDYAFNCQDDPAGGKALVYLYVDAGASSPFTASDVFKVTITVKSSF